MYTEEGDAGGWGWVGLAQKASQRAVRSWDGPQAGWKELRQSLGSGASFGAWALVLRDLRLSGREARQGEPSARGLDLRQGW